MFNKNKKRTIYFLLAIAIFILLGIAFLFLQKKDASVKGERDSLESNLIKKAQPSQEKGSNAALDAWPEGLEHLKPKPPTSITREELVIMMDEVLAKLQSPHSNLEQKRAELARLRSALLGAKKEEAIAAILSTLQEGKDTPTGLFWRLSSEGGILKDAPTLRTFLLDVFGEVDAVAAAHQAEEIFASSSSSEEWAIALRNLSWDNNEGERNEILHERFMQIAQREEWQGNVGFFESFDMLSHLGGHTGVEERVALMLEFLGATVPEGEAPNGISNAAYLSLDEYSRREPNLFFEQMMEANLTEKQQLSRASLLSTSLAFHENRQEALEIYLQNPAIGMKEKELFLSLYPNHNTFLGGRLLTGYLKNRLPIAPIDLDREAYTQLQKIRDSFLDDYLKSALDSALERARVRVEQFESTKL